MRNTLITMLNVGIAAILSGCTQTDPAPPAAAGTRTPDRTRQQNLVAPLSDDGPSVEAIGIVDVDYSDKPTQGNVGLVRVDYRDPAQNIRAATWRFENGTRCFAVGPAELPFAVADNKTIVISAMGHADRRQRINIRDERMVKVVITVQ